jgi:hypothetical protein
MKRLLILGAVSGAAFVAMTALSTPPVRAQTIACAAEIPSARKGHWYYRIIDGRKCWYEGKALMPQSDLYWPKEKVADVDAAPIAQRPAPAETDGRNPAAAPAPEPAVPMAAPVAAPAWPAPSVANEISFEQRWLGLRSRP